MKNIVDPDSFLRLAHTKTTRCHNLHASSIRVIMHSKPAIVDTFSNICYLCKDLFWMLTFLQEIHPQLWFSLWWNKLNLITKELVNWKSLNSEMPHYNILYTRVHSKTYRTHITAGNVYIATIKPSFQQPMFSVQMRLCTEDLYFPGERHASEVQRSTLLNTRNV
jgi:hypothetical protein